MAEQQDTIEMVVTGSNVHIVDPETNKATLIEAGETVSVSPRFADANGDKLTDPEVYKAQQAAEKRRKAAEKARATREAKKAAAASPEAGTEVAAQK